MKRLLFSIFLIVTLTTACEIKQVGTPAPDLVATQVAVVLTSMPSATLSPIESPAPTNEPQPTGTQIPSPTLTLTTVPSPTLIDTPTPAVTASATKSTTDPKESLGQPTWERNTFEVGKDFGYFDNKKLVITAKHANSYLGWTLTYPRPQHFYLEANITTSSCSGLDTYGLVFHASDYTESKGYFLGFSCDGQYNLRSWDGSQFSDLITWKPAAGLNSGSNKTNRLGVMVVGNKFTFYVNGNLLSDLEDDAYPDAGHFGLFIAAVNTPGFNVQLSDIAYWDIE
jgi:hypothetical protein